MPILLLFGFTQEMHGWSRAEVITLVGAYQIITGLMAAFVAPNLNRMTAYITEGELDSVLLRPVSSQFYLTLRWINVAELSNVASGIVVLVIGLVQSGTSPDAGQVLQALVLAACGVVLLAAVWSAMSFLAFWLQSVNPIGAIYLNLVEAGPVSAGVLPGGGADVPDVRVPGGVRDDVPGPGAGGRPRLGAGRRRDRAVGGRDDARPDAVAPRVALVRQRELLVPGAGREWDAGGSRVWPGGVGVGGPAGGLWMVDRRRRGVRTALVGEALRVALAGRARTDPGAGLDIVDLGGGTGGFAVPLAVEGHRVTVVDPSPDALASLERRASDEGVSELVRGVQGDAAELPGLAGESSADAVLCHGVLEVVDDPVQALQAMASVLREGGVLSLLVAQRNAVVLARALAGHLADARVALQDPDGRWGPTDPMPRRFDEAGITAQLADAGFMVHTVHGVRTFADLVPSAFVDSEPGAAESLAELERAASQHPAFRALATQLHILATR